MYHIVYKIEGHLIPTGVTIKAENPIKALNNFVVTHPHDQFIVMYKVNECNGNLEW